MELIQALPAASRQQPAIEAPEAPEAEETIGPLVVVEAPADVPMALEPAIEQEKQGPAIGQEELESAAEPEKPVEASATPAVTEAIEAGGVDARASGAAAMRERRFLEAVRWYGQALREARARAAEASGAAGASGGRRSTRGRRGIGKRAAGGAPE